ncbi:MAG: anaerobic ribonucleoside-triphosphate reductase activating protein [Quinella sp. 1Q5]|nr:anaerobic ribonucleoside-triphosphate reductase activating protein [Quinella sp. 1Q5]
MFLLIRIAGLVSESYVDGDGIRFAIFMQGCLRRCEGCHNPETHALDGGRLVDTAKIIAKIKKNPLLDGITLTGGEPLLQIDAANEIACAAKSFGLSVWCYTGYNFEELPHDAEPLLENIDVLIDGAFIERLRDLDLQFRGSRNQRIIDIKKTREQNKIVLWSEIGG